MGGIEQTNGYHQGYLCPSLTFREEIKFHCYLEAPCYLEQMWRHLESGDSLYLKTQAAEAQCVVVLIPGISCLSGGFRIAFCSDYSFFLLFFFSLYTCLFWTHPHFIHTCMWLHTHTQTHHTFFIIPNIDALYNRELN